jgi:hypothetical protein
MHKVLFLFLAAAITCAPAHAQIFSATGVTPDVPRLDVSRPVDIVLANPVAPPRMAPDLALARYEERSARQSRELAAYSAVMTIQAALLDTAQKGEYELSRRFEAPNNLHFKPLRFSGDGFVKSNVIVRLLQAEVQHLSKGQAAQTAINRENYKIQYKGHDEIDGQAVYVFQIKPRKKLAGMIKGMIFLDPFTGALRRVQGKPAKSPSFFVKKVEFTQDYRDFGEFTLPVVMHSEARVRIFGRAVVDVVHRDYEPKSSTQLRAESQHSSVPAGLQ